MLKYAGYDIVFQEIPDEVTLAVNLSGCPNGCPGCHSPHLQRDEGEPLDAAALDGLLARYGGQITCVCFMGGDAAPDEVARLAAGIRGRAGGSGARLRTAWYSGRPTFPPGVDPAAFDYVKLGPYVEKRGGLDSRTTNQRLYRIERPAPGAPESGISASGTVPPSGAGSFPAEALPLAIRDLTPRFWRD